MRPPICLLALAGALLLGGCSHISNTSAKISASGTERARGPQVAPRKQLHVYVDCLLPTEDPARNRALAETVALTLRDVLRQRGFDVRGAEAIVRDPATPSAPEDAVARLGYLARAVGPGTAEPATVRYATYLHANAPRLMLFVAVEPSATDHRNRQPKLQLGAFLTDSGTGDILWSGCASARSNVDDQSVRQLAGKLLRSLELQPPP